MGEKPARYIALVDLDAFFASVEVLERPELKGKPVLIGGSAFGRGVVAAASYEARKFGVHSAMPMGQALRKCPQAIVLPTRHSLYREYSKRVMHVLGEATPLVQQMSIDEAYLDLMEVANSLAEAEAVMLRAQKLVWDEIGLPCSVGLAANKMMAKIACEAGKPRGFVLVVPGEEAEFLSPLPVREMPGIGPKAAERLLAEGLNTLGELALAPLPQLTSLFGPWGAVLQRRAMGEDPSPVQMEREAKSISAEETFVQDIDDQQALYQELDHLSGQVVESLRKQGYLARTVILKLRYADFTTITRSMSRPNATANLETIEETAHQLLDANWDPEQAVRLVGVGVSNLRPRQAEGQLAMELP
jgi:DNA polymerase-4